jgi:hypothetical protein
MAKPKTQAKQATKPKRVAPKKMQKEPTLTPTQKFFAFFDAFSGALESFLDDDQHFEPGQYEEMQLVACVVAFLGGMPAEEAFANHPRLLELAKGL